MLSFNSSSTYVQTQFSSGFDSVTQGIAQTSNTTGLAGIQAAFDSFSSFETTEAGDFGGITAQQSLAAAGDFSSPETYAQSQVQDSANKSKDPLLGALQNSYLSTGDELSKVSGILSQFASEAAQQGIIIVSGSPEYDQARSGASKKVEQAGLITPPQVGGSTKLEQAGVFAPPQVGGSTKLEQAGVFAPPQFGGSTKLDQAGLITPPQVGGSTQLEQAGLMTPPQFGDSTKLEQAGLMTPPQYGGPFAQLNQQGITLSSSQATAVANMSGTVADAANLYKVADLSMLSRKIIG